MYQFERVTSVGAPGGVRADVYKEKTDAATIYRVSCRGEYRRFGSGKTWSASFDEALDLAEAAVGWRGPR